jgi:hypothetical protein
VDPMEYKCEICGQIFKTKSGPLSKAHIASKIHQYKLNGTQKPVNAPINASINAPMIVKKAPSVIESDKSGEIILFLAIKELKLPNYSNILSFCSSFGMKNEDIIEILIKKIREQDIQYNFVKDQILQKIITTLIRDTRLKYPYTLTVMDAFSMFRELKPTDPSALVHLFQELGQKYPGFAILSASKLGDIEDLITFKRIFPDDGQFELQNRWGL